MCVALHPSCGVNLRACLNAYSCLYAAELERREFEAEPGSDPRLVPGTKDLQPTPLSLAICARRYDVMKSLLAVGAEATAINYIAKDKQFIGMIQRPELVTYDLSWSPIFMAAGNGASGADIALLIARGADPNVGDGHSTPLHQAIRTKNISALEALVQAKGIDLNATGSRPARGSHPSEWTPLREAVDCKSFTAVKMLLDRGASTESRDNRSGYSPLLAAVYNGDIVTAKYQWEQQPQLYYGLVRSRR